MNEFSSGGTTTRGIAFFISTARMVVTCAFRRLKGQFGILRKRIGTKLKTTLDIIFPCFISQFL